jgi:hypothetical protein
MDFCKKLCEAPKKIQRRINGADVSFETSPPCQPHAWKPWNLARKGPDERGSEVRSWLHQPLHMQISFAKWDENARYFRPALFDGLMTIETLRNRKPHGGVVGLFEALNHTMVVVFDEHTSFHSRLHLGLPWQGALSAANRFTGCLQAKYFDAE